MLRKKGKLAFIAIIALVSYGGFLIANFPASNAWSYLSNRQLPVQLSGISGTIWSGAVDKVIIKTRQQPIILPQVTWHLQPTALLQAKLSASLTVGSATTPIEGSGYLVIDRQTLMLNNLTLDTTAPWLMAFSKSAFPINTTGNVSVQINRAEFNRQGCLAITGKSKLENSQLSSPFGEFDLGDSLAVLSCQNHKLVADINQNSSMFKSQGNFLIGMDKKYRFTGKTTPDASLPKEIKQGLSLLGRPDNRGRYPLKFSGSL